MPTSDNSAATDRELATYERQPAETPRAWHAFCLYRDAGPGRSAQKVARECGKSVSLLLRWSAKYDWVRRAHAYDAHRERMARRACEAEQGQELAAFRERTRKAAIASAAVALATLVKVGTRLKELEAGQIAPHLIPGFLRAAAAVLEASLNAEAEAIGVRALQRLLDGEGTAP